MPSVGNQHFPAVLWVFQWILAPGTEWWCHLARRLHCCLRPFMAMSPASHGVVRDGFRKRRRSLAGADRVGGVGHMRCPAARCRSPTSGRWRGGFKQGGAQAVGLAGGDVSGQGRALAPRMGGFPPNWPVFRGAIPKPSNTTAGSPAPPIVCRACARSAGLLHGAARR